MKPRHEHEQEGERRCGLADGSASERLGASAFPGREPGTPAAVVETRAPMADLAAWLDGLTAADDDGAAPPDGPEGPHHVCPEADELLLALAEVDRRPRTPSVRPSRSAQTLGAPPQTLALRYDARLLAERLLAESQQHAVLEAEPFELLEAQGGLDAMSEDLLARLLAGLAASPLGADVGASVGAAERGLLALLALQLYVQESKVRQARRPADPNPVTQADPVGERDERLLEVLAVPHAASRPLGERRPRGRPRR